MDYVGQEFGRLTVLSVAMVMTDTRSRRVATCSCSCGSRAQVRVDYLLSGNTRSCGCIQRERMTAGRTREIHGLTAHPLYGTWADMMSRCYNVRAGNYRWYGALGVRVDKRWHDPDKFITYIERHLGARPNGMTLDRIDPFRSYKPGNVRWATRQEQMRNTRKAQHVRNATRNQLTLF